MSRDTSKLSVAFFKSSSFNVVQLSCMSPSVGQYVTYNYTRTSYIPVYLPVTLDLFPELVLAEMCSALPMFSRDFHTTGKEGDHLVIGTCVIISSN